MSYAIHMTYEHHLMTNHYSLIVSLKLFESALYGNDFQYNFLIQSLKQAFFRKLIIGICK
jgi:hypothetical protein